jgi:hypothetical protein
LDSGALKNAFSGVTNQIWWMPVEGYLLQCIVRTVKFGGGALMVWINAVGTSMQITFCHKTISDVCQ